MKPYGVIYAILCLENDKIYIGQTTQSTKERWYGHCYMATKRRYKTECGVAPAIRCYGPEAFVCVEIMHCYSKQELDDAEKILIKAWNTLAPNGYNYQYGGSNGKHSEETKAKISIGNRKKRRPWTQEARDNCRRAQLGRTHSEATKKKISDSNKGKLVSDATREKLSVVAKNRMISEQTRAKLSEANRRRAPISEETRLRCSLARSAWHARNKDAKKV